MEIELKERNIADMLEYVDLKLLETGLSISY